MAEVGFLLSLCFLRVISPFFCFRVSRPFRNWDKYQICQLHPLCVDIRPGFQPHKTIQNMSQLTEIFILSKAGFSSVAQSCLTLGDPMDCSTPGFLVYHQLLEFTQTHVRQVGDATQTSHPLSSPSPLPSIFPSIRVFSNESVLHIRWPKYWSFSFSISPSNEYSGLVSFRIAWFDLLAVQGTLKSLLQHHSSKVSILQCSAFFIVQLSRPYITTGKTITLTILTFIGKVKLLYRIVKAQIGDPCWLCSSMLTQFL